MNTVRKTVFETYRPRTILNKHKRPDHWFWTRYTAYPYIGCQHGCHFCYCRESKYAPYDTVDDFPYRIKVKENAPALLRKALDKLPRDVVAVGDYQPAEKKFEISRRMLEVCRDLRFPVFILERSPLVLRDLDLLIEINEIAHVSVLFSIIHTMDSPHAERISAMERLAPTPDRRFDAMAKIAEKGIQTGVCFMPILPDLCDTDENIDLVVRKTADHGGGFVLASPLTLADQQKAYFFRHLEANEPSLLDTYKNFYPANSYGPYGGRWLKVGRKVREKAVRYGIKDRMPRPIRPGEKRAASKRAVERLAGMIYTMELEGKSERSRWPYRKAAWAVEDTQQDIGLIYRTMGIQGLKNIKDVGPKICGILEEVIRAENSRE